jgi:transposase
MRGKTTKQRQLFHTFQMEDVVPEDHPLRGIKKRVDSHLKAMSKEFDEAYPKMGRPGVPPERLLKATLLMALYSIRSERQLCEQIAYNLLYRWFLDMSPDEEIWDHSVFSINRERFETHGLMAKFFSSTVTQAVKEEAASLEHFSVDGTLVQAWASMKSFRSRDEEPGEDEEGPKSNRWVDFHGEKRSNETHESKTDPEARLYRKGFGQESKLAHGMHVLMENRNGLLMGISLSEANGKAEREEAMSLLHQAPKAPKGSVRTLGADKGYDDEAFFAALQKKHKTQPHVALRLYANGEPAQGECRQKIWQMQQKKESGYQMSRKARMFIETRFSWLKKIAGLAKTRFVGRWKTQQYAYVCAGLFNLMQLQRLHSV